MQGPFSSLLFDESNFEKLSDQKKPFFIFDWLLHLDNRLPHEAKKDIQEIQEDLVQQLLSQLSCSSSPPTHRLIGRCLAKLFIAGDTLLLYTAVNTCNGMLRSRDDGASSTTTRLAALLCLSTIYKSMGRMIGRSFEDSVSLMVKLIKQSESQVRCETMLTLCSLLEAVGSAASVCNKDIYKAAKSCMTDRVLSVRAAACKCLYELCGHYAPLYNHEMESVLSLCFRCMDGSNYAVRMEAARLIGRILAKSQQQQQQAPTSTAPSSPARVTQSSGTISSSRSKAIMPKDAFLALAPGFLKGPGGFLKGSTATDMLKGTNSVNREVRIGVTYAYVEFVSMMGSHWLESNLDTVISHCVHLLINPRAIPTQAEAIFARHCVGYILTTLFHRLLSEPAVLAAARELVVLLRRQLHAARGAECVEETNVELDTTDAPTDSGKKVVEPTALELEDPNCAAPSISPKTSDADSNVLTKRGFGRASTRTQRQRQQQHIIVCILDQLTEVIRQLDSACAPLLDQPVGLIDLLCTALIHPIASVRFAAAKCLRQLVVVLPHQRVPTLDGCISSLRQAQRSNGDSILGYGGAIGAILSGATVDVLGVPSDRASQIFSLAEELLREANQNSRLTLSRTQAGWTMLASYLSLGPDQVRPRLPQLLLFWRNAFPRSVQELEAEKQRGDAFTWQVVLEARAGALCSIQVFLEYCSPLLHTEDVINRLLAPIESALNMIPHLLDLVRLYGNHLKAIATMVRHRLYRILLLLPHAAYSSSYSTLLRELVAELTLTDSVSNTTTSLLRSLCRSDDNVPLGFWTQDTDQKTLEEQVQPNIAVSPAALEHDPAYLFLRDGLTGITVVAPCPSNGFMLDQGLEHSPHGPSSVSFYHSVDLSAASSLPPVGLSTCSTWPTYEDGNRYSPSAVLQTGGLPPPVSVAVIDSAVELFGRVYPYVPMRHRVQMMDHFAECIRLAKSARQEAIQINVFAALLNAMRRLTETKAAFGEATELRDSLINLNMVALASPCILLRCAAGECMGRLAQLVADPSFLSELAQNLFERLRSIRNPISRAGHCLAIGCLHRYVGGLASGQHVNTSVGILLAIAQDSSVPEVQVWALYALALVADSGGPMFREYVSPSLDLVFQLLLRSASTAIDIQRSLGRLLSTLITTIGPELHGSTPSVTITRRSCLMCCLIMQHSNDPVLQAESVSCMQRLHMFASQQLEIPVVGPELQDYISSPHLLLRRAAASYFRQLSQKESDVLLTLVSLNRGKHHAASSYKESKKPPKSSLALELLLFRRLDVEPDVQTRRDIEETIVSLLQLSAHSRLGQWLATLKEVLQATTAEEYAFKPVHAPQLHTANRPDPVSTGGASVEQSASEVTSHTVPNGSHDLSNAEVIEDGDAGINDSLGGNNRVALNASTTTTKTKWPTRVFAVGCVRVLMAVCSRLFRLAATDTQSSLVTSPNGSTNGTDSFFTDPSAVAHFDLALARCLRASRKPNLASSDWLVLHLSDLIRIAFISATSDSSHLRISGLKLMQDVIHRFARVADPDCSGTASDCTLALHPQLTSVACLVCSTWIGSGVARDAQNLRRVHELLRLAFDNLRLSEVDFSTCSRRAKQPQESKSSYQLYCSDAMTMEKLAVLRAWADVYTSAIRFSYSRNVAKLPDVDKEDADASAERCADDQEDQFSAGEPGESDDDLDTVSASESHICDSSWPRRTYLLLSHLVRPLLPTLSKAWIAILQDYAMLSLPDELSAERPVTGGIFYGHDSIVDRVRPYYMQHWPAVSLAASMWIQNELSDHNALDEGDSDARTLRRDFSLILGICVNTICDAGAKQSFGLVNTCLEAVYCLLRHSACRAALMCQYPKVPVELLHILYRVLLTVDHIDTHLLCLSIVKQVLQGAEERLVKQREIWLSENSSTCDSRLLLTSDTSSKTALTNTSSSTAQTTSLVDAQMFELAEGGSLAFELKQPVESQHPGEKGLHPRYSVVFASLEILVCVFARYCPEMLTELRMVGPSAACNHLLPEARCANGTDAPNVLAAALRCLLSLPDLCAPHVLLSSLSLSSATAETGSVPGSCDTSSKFADNLLVVLLDCFVRISQVVLLQPYAPASPLPTDNIKSAICRNTELSDSVNKQHCMDSYALYLCDIDAHTDVTSTANSTHSASAARQRKLEQRRRRLHVDRLLSWTFQQSKLAAVIVRLAVQLANHHYPVLASTRSPVRSTSSWSANSDMVSDTTPDSSSTQRCSVANAQSVDEVSSEVARQGHHSQPTDQVLLRSSAAASEWYGLVSNSLLDLLRHRHNDLQMVGLSTCCLRSLTLVSRIAAECPVAVFNSKDLRNQLVLQIRHLWEVAGLLTPSIFDSAHGASCVEKDPVSPLSNSSSCNNPFRKALSGLTQRRVCLSAIEVLVNHREPVVNTFFARTITPQIFQWICDLSTRDTPSGLVVSDKLEVKKNSLVDCFNAAVDILEALVNLSDASNRQGLLAIFVPLLCGLLSPAPPNRLLLTRWSAASTVTVDSAELRCGLHVNALQRLVSIAPLYPTDFRSVFNALGDHKSRLQLAIKSSAALQDGHIPYAVSSSEATGLSIGRPVIQLKTNFSGFLQDAM
ncbi:unnamed protein product [Dicrocoelium dendriticum]|nr:unnamed protein product [Dicrocoelium dendriticum]